MKVSFLFALFLACANASALTDKFKNLIPSFATGYIINGEDAEPQSAPYIVSLSSSASSHSHKCGGTIIAKDWILTAGHCIATAVGMGVIAGLQKRSQVDENTQSRVVDFGRVHESYSGSVGPYDIAILHISEPFEFNERVQPASLPHREEIHSGETHLYGWGQTKWYIFTAAQTLQTVQTEVVEWNECKETLPEGAPLHETNVCSDSLQKGISACNGDSGGPLVKEINGGPSELIGIVSWGYIPCGVSNLPSVYTRVSAFIAWITNIQSAYYILH
ncbi:PREDICTED: lectizyme-like [Rhagoletis zephyria]|uniref:lectizyme-like n=1 Tax=Rhagoletis zephyria TaxID=28612 RepID=UPI00081198D7|nr:PREDICTED: lectizyme-like [Rhagoletis zephyria]